MLNGNDSNVTNTGATTLPTVQMSQVVYKNVGGFSNYTPDDSNDVLLTTAMFQ